MIGVIEFDCVIFSRAVILADFLFREVY